MILTYSILIFIANALVVAGFTVGQVVRTSSGPVQGHAAEPAPDVSEYLGIPFAKPPVGSLRFEPPQPFNSSGMLIFANNFSVSCPSSLPPLPRNTQKGNPFKFAPNGATLLQSGSPTGYGEDCLTINVWTKPQEGEASKAVMVWIYGGSFESGSSSEPVYNGARFADQVDVVLVSFNYRTNIFGFGNGPSGVKNIGLLDQRFAIQWVRDNIAGFGGDPNRITIFGQSAGGISVDYYTYAWTSDPIIQAVIAMSGSVFTVAPATPDQNRASWVNITTQLGCAEPNNSESQVLSCMQTKNTSEITEAVIKADSVRTGGLLGSFGPTIDEEVVFSDYVARAMKGRFIQKPLLIGNTNYEAGFLKARVALTYGAETAEIMPPDYYWDAYDNITLACAAAHRAYYSYKVGLPTWRYRYFGNFPNLRLTTIPDSGAYHGSDLAMIFDNLQGLGPSTPQQTAIGREMRAAWGAFAKFPADGLSRLFNWEEFEPGRSSLIRLAYNNATGPNYGESSTYDYPCPLMLALAGDEGATASSFDPSVQEAYIRVDHLSKGKMERISLAFQI